MKSNRRYRHGRGLRANRKFWRRFIRQAEQGLWDVANGRVRYFEHRTDPDGSTVLTETDSDGRRVVVHRCRPNPEPR